VGFEGLRRHGWAGLAVLCARWVASPPIGRAGRSARRGFSRALGCASRLGACALGLTPLEDNRYTVDNRYLGEVIQQEVVLAMLAKESSHGYQLRARLREALGPLGDTMNAGQIYVTLTRLEKAGLAVSEQSAAVADRPDRKVYTLTPDGQQRVAEWLAEVNWPKPDLAEFHLKLVAAAAAGLADPLTIVDVQRRELLRRLRDAQRAAMAEPDGSDAALLLEGVVLRLQADLRWLEACEQSWTDRRSRS
jgi:DNA-binding PadR family transcriptional regulator